MPKCFVIQPFDKGKFDKRYDDVFEPAIKDAVLEPYRVDRDPSVSIPIENIEKQIRDSDICLADISLNNPNIWYEVGYALACGKEVVLTSCRSDRTDEKFPFDIQHRNVITYVSESPSDFQKLRKQITDQLRSRLEKNQEIKALVISDAPKTAGLMPHEMAILVALSGETVSNLEDVPVNILRHSLEQAGFTSSALGLGIRRLEALHFIRKRSRTDPEGFNFFTVELNPKGEQWLFDNIEKIQLRKPSGNTASRQEFLEENDIPF